MQKRKIVEGKFDLEIRVGDFIVAILTNCYVVESEQFYEIYTKDSTYITCFLKETTEYIPFEKAVNDANE